ncbi:MAG: OmpA family protein, partial [Planctomycetota bacterium]
VSPTATAAPGDTLRYTLRLQATDVPLNNLTLYDDLGSLNATPVFESGTLGLVTVPPGADITATDPTGGTNGAGILDIGNLSVSANSDILVQFDITLDSTLIDGTVVLNQADLISTAKIADSDDPNINGQADPSVAGDEDPTRVVIATVPVGPLLKENTQAAASIGESFSYQITVPETPYPFPIYDAQITDDLTASAADLRFLGLTKITGSEPWVPVNTGTDTNVVIEDMTIGIDIPADEQVVVEITVVLEDTPTNVAGLTFTNTASFLYNLLDDDDTSQRSGTPGTTQPMTIVGPDVLTMDKYGPAHMNIGTPGTFRYDVHNAGTGPAWNLTITDQLPDSLSGGTCDTAPSAFTAQVFEFDGVTPVSAPLAEGTDFTTAALAAPACLFTLTALTPAAVIGVDQRLLVTYQAELDSDTQDGVALTNVAGATQWFSAQGADRREYTRTLTDGTIGVLDHEDAFTTVSALPQLRFEKTVLNVATGADPAVTARPGEILRYRLEVENLSTVSLADFSLYDEIDRLNLAPLLEPGSLQLVTVPAGADTSNTSSTGGAQGTGAIDVRNLTLPNQGDTVVVEFEVTLAAVISTGTYATNQSELRIGGAPFLVSDDPNVNGPADPLIAGDEDPTRVLIESAPVFQVEKISDDLTGDPTVLQAGETLRYTITVKNVGSDNATDAVLRDQIPVNTQYVAGSTHLNGSPVADLPGNVAPLSAGIPIHAPEDPRPGAMRADPSPAADNVATLVFDVVVDGNVPDGTVISNQAFVSAVAGGIVDQPSDDPGTPVPDDPTRDVVGNLPLLFAAKRVAIQVDAGTAGVVDPGDVLRYTITLSNSGGIPATNVSLSDSVPANTSYVADSSTLNGLPVGQPDAGVSPLMAGIPVSSSDLTPPLPAPGLGTVTSGETAVVEFDLRVDNGVPTGTIISNQALVMSAELPNLLTDGDGNPATGPEPTIVVVGDGQQLAVTKSVAVVGGGAALPGSQLEYVVRVVNVATVPASSVVITDDLDLPVAGQLAYVPASATLNGAPAGVSVVGSLITADYSASNGFLPPGETVVLRFLATIGAGLAMGTTVTNTGVVTWNAPPQTASADVSVDVGGMPGVGLLSGALWHDADFDTAQGGGERALEGWSVELYRNAQLVHSALSDAAGAYQISGLEPNDVNGDQYALRFRAPGAGATTGSLGRAASPFTNGFQEITDIVVTSGSNLLDLNLPIQPNGVVYDSVQRAPIAGARLSLLNASSGAPLPAACFDDPAQQGQVTISDGYYKFDLNFSGAACPSGGSYLIDVAGAAAGYGNGFSGIIPPITDASTTPLSVPMCPGSVDDAVPATAQHCEVQTSEFAPPSSVTARTPGTNFHTHVVLDSSQMPGSSQLFNNHLAMDPVADSALAITKTTPSTDVILGQLVPYEITVRNRVAVDLVGLSVVDRFPAGFRYVKDSAKLDGAPFEPTINGRELVWTGIDVAASGSRTLRLLLAVGAGVSEGEYINRAQVISTTGSVPLSGEAIATVRVVPDPDFACTDVMGKVFADADRDGFQDAGERGLEGVRLVTPRGLTATTDPYGRFHITCAIVPHPERGSNMVLKLDDRSLPSGYRLSTRQVQVKRASRGKALRFHFGASIHRVVGLDLADAVFEPGTTEMRLQWKDRIQLLLEELQKSPATLRLAYVADAEDERLVDRRLAAVKQEIIEAWEALEGDPLTIEPEIYWRRGAPPSDPMARLPGFGRWASMVSSNRGAPAVTEAGPGNATERILSHEQPLTPWTHDPELLEAGSGDRLEEREVLTEKAETVKLRNVVPPIRFDSGVSKIPPRTIEKLRSVLGEMQHLDNVRLHLIGHADDQPLSGALAGTYGDNQGLSRERAGEVAEFVQAALQLPPEAISFSWAGDAEPLASNATSEGRAQNRRVEVEVWYDEFEEGVAVEEVVVSEDIKRVKVCRLETVCKMRFLEGHERRARIKNLIAPLQVGEENARVSKDLVRQVDQALRDLRDKQGVTVKFIGFTDNAPLTGRAERIYGSHLALSKAMARRVSLEIQDALDLPTSAVASDGRGASLPLASNETPRGRALNRRIEVELWYDDTLQELPDEPQLCPDPAGESTVTRVYDPPWGGI